MRSFHIFRFTLAPDQNRENRHQLNLWRAACAVFLLCAATAIAARGQTFTSLLSFDGTDGNYPSAPLVQGTDGNLYGTNTSGGAFGAGTVFKITRGGTVTTLHNFAGYWPSGLVLATDGNLYGTTAYAGAFGGGYVFKITPAGTLTTLYNFCAQPNCTDGSYPGAGVVQAADGNFYGGTDGGGAFGGGTLFKITPTGKLTTLYSFCAQTGCPDGMGPLGLIQATDGNFYGEASSGGTYGIGTVFKITPTGTLTTTHSFAGPDGSEPGAPLLQGRDGSFYGTTVYGGADYGAGMVFKITPAGTLTRLYSFAGTDGANPFAGLVQATDGNLYGTALDGGLGSSNCNLGTCGTVFKMTPTGTLITLHSFSGTDGDNPSGTMQATDGNLYGATINGGASDGGTIFSLTLGLPPFVSFIRALGGVGWTVQILGQGFTGTTSVSFNGTPATFTIKSDTYLTAAVPAGATTGFVTVTTPSNTLKSNKIFRVLPQILSFSPTSGPAGTSVVITGKSFTQATAVSLDYKHAMSFTVDSDTQITAIVPTGAPSGKIGVTTAGGRTESAASFTVTD